MRPALPFAPDPILSTVVLLMPHGHPEPAQWQDSGSWGARHINDNAPFRFWDVEGRRFRSPNQKEFEWIRQNFHNV